MVAIGLAVVVGIWWTVRPTPVVQLQDLAATLVLVGASLLADPVAAFLPAVVVSILIVFVGPRLLQRSSPGGASAEGAGIGSTEAAADVAPPRAVPEDVQRALRLNDRLAEWLTYAKTGLERYVAQNPDAGLKELRDEIDSAIEEVGERTRQMRARITATEPLTSHLPEILDWWEQHYGCEVSLRVTDPDARLSEPVEQELLTILLEAVDNAGRHAQAEQLSVRWEIIGDDGVLRIADDGVGFDTFATTGPGLDAMFRAADRIGRSMRIDSMPGSGTVIIVRATDRP
jgi:signal transduction histidine kinase